MSVGIINYIHILSVVYQFFSSLLIKYQWQTCITTTNADLTVYIYNLNNMTKPSRQAKSSIDLVVDLITI